MPGVGRRDWNQDVIEDMARDLTDPWREFEECVEFQRIEICSIMWDPISICGLGRMPSAYMIRRY